MTKIYGHRGAKGHYPENTLLAFQKALEAGAQGIELDVHLTKDDKLVVVHDATLERTTTGSGYVIDHTLAQLKELSAGEKFSNFEKYESSWDDEKIPTLEETLDLLSKYDIELNIELKTYEVAYPDVEAKLLQAIKDSGYSQKIVYSSFHLPTILRIKKLDDKANIAFLDGRIIPFAQDFMETLKLEALHIDVKEILKRPDYWKQFAKQLRVWTANEPKEIQALLDMGVAAIITDYPSEAIGLAENM